jgi:hypothetical protein
MSDTLTPAELTRQFRRQIAVEDEPPLEPKGESGEADDVHLQQQSDGTPGEPNQGAPTEAFRSSQSSQSSKSCEEQRYWLGKYNPACNAVYFSFVLTVRNDNYGGSFQQRVRAMLQSTVLAFNEQAESGEHMASGQPFSAEIVLVEYRPTAAEPRMRDIVAAYISPFLTSKHVRIRIITVPEFAIKKWPDPKGLIVAEYIGKNIGIRRARGEFVLAANADDILTRALISFLGKGKLNTGAYYRAPLMDPFFPEGGSGGWSDLPYDDFKNRTAEYTRDDKVCKIKPKSCVRPQSVSSCKQSTSCYVYAEEVDYNGDVCSAGGLKGQAEVKNHPSLKVFSNINLQAPGDFILMSRQDWFSIGAHAEALAHRHHFDGWVECRAVFQYRKAQINLNPPCAVLHQDHGGKIFRQGIVTAGGAKAEEGRKSGKFFNMALNGVPNASYKTILASTEELSDNVAEVRASRELTRKWCDSFARAGYKAKVLGTWDWNHQLDILFGPRVKPPRWQIQQVCATTMRGGAGERLFDGNRFHPEHFGFPEWVFEEVEFSL